MIGSKEKRESEREKEREGHKGGLGRREREVGWGRAREGIKWSRRGIRERKGVRGGI